MYILRPSVLPERKVDFIVHTAPVFQFFKKKIIHNFYINDIIHKNHVEIRKKTPILRNAHIVEANVNIYIKKFFFNRMIFKNTCATTNKIVFTISNYFKFKSLPLKSIVSREEKHFYVLK